jgi:hypothetical protein
MEGLGLTGSGGIEEIRRWCLQTPAWNLRSLAASWARERRGKGRGGRGPFILVVGSSIKAGGKGIDGGGRSYWKRSPAGVSVQAWRRPHADVGVPPVSERKGREGVPVRLRGFLGRGLFSRLGWKVSPGSILIFYFFFVLFLFWIFCFEFWKSSSIQI